MKRSWLILVIICLLLAACGGSAEEPQSLDLSGEWKLTSLNGQELLPESTITLVFENGQAGGSAGCNSYGGSYNLDGSSLAIGSLVQTEMACMEPQGLMEQESLYLQTLSTAVSVRQNGDTLEILGGDNQVLLAFAR